MFPSEFHAVYGVFPSEKSDENGSLVQSSSSSKLVGIFPSFLQDSLQNGYFMPTSSYFNANGLPNSGMATQQQASQSIMQQQAIDFGLMASTGNGSTLNGTLTAVANSTQQGSYPSGTLKVTTGNTWIRVFPVGFKVSLGRTC